MIPPTKNDRDLSRVIKLSSALCMGLMGGFVYSIKSVNPHLRLEFSMGVVLSAATAGAATWGFLAVIFRREHEGGNARARRRFLSRWMFWFVATMGAATAVAFARSLQGISPQRVRDVLVGTVGAILFVSFFLYLLWRLLRFLEDDSERNAGLVEEEDDPPPDP
ncbi:MAG TPA: hypothetical protein VNO52_06190 [Methylomirabilota bacterium]|nr:hypothetical protein [Methylomirabilota bacterium]